MTHVAKIIIADDHAVVRTGLQLILDDLEDLSVVDEARNGGELIEKLQTGSYDLVILDISMPGKDTMDVLREIKSRRNDLPVVIFSMNPDEIYAVRMLANGASAYVNKETRPAQIIEVLRTVLKGKKYIFPHQAELFTSMLSSPQPGADRPLHHALTDREFQVFVMLASGIKKTEIAEKLSISKNTINNHRNNILKKMNMFANSELTRYAIQNGIIQ